MLCCQALQKNGDSVIGKTTKMSEALNIWFLDDLTISNDAGNFTVIVYSNPEPKLTVVCEEEVETCKNLSLSDFAFEKVPDNDFMYESLHQIFETEQEWMKTVSLQFEVVNVKNQTKSDVKPLIEIKDEEATGDDLDNPEENNKTDEEQVEGEGEDEGGNAGEVTDETTTVNSTDDGNSTTINSGGNFIQAMSFFWISVVILALFI